MKLRCIMKSVSILCWMTIFILDRKQRPVGEFPRGPVVRMTWDLAPEPVGAAGGQDLALGVLDEDRRDDTSPTPHSMLQDLIPPGVSRIRTRLTLFWPLQRHMVHNSPCLILAVWHCHKPFSQWQRSFHMKAALSLAERLADSKVHVANMGPIWGRQDPGGPHVGPRNFAIWAWSVMTR